LSGFRIRVDAAPFTGIAAEARERNLLLRASEAHRDAFLAHQQRPSWQLVDDALESWLAVQRDRLLIFDRPWRSDGKGAGQVASLVSIRPSTS